MPKPARTFLKLNNSSCYKTAKTASDFVKIDAELLGSKQSQNSVSKAKSETKSDTRRVQSGAYVCHVRWRSDNAPQNDSQNRRRINRARLFGRRQAKSTTGGQKNEPQKTAAQGVAFQ